MGKRSDEIQHELERRRNALEARVERLKRRIRDDVDTVKTEGRADFDQTVGRDSTVAHHPRALLGGAAATGVVLGMVTESVHVPRPHLGGDGREAEGERRRKGLMASATDSAADALQAPLAEAAKDVWKAFVSGFTGKPKVNDLSRLPPGVRGTRARARGEGDAAEIVGGAAASHGERFRTREDISSEAVDADMVPKEGEKSPEEVLHDARVEHFAPREDLPAYSGIQGEGLLLPRTPGVQAPYEEDEQRGERRTGQ